MTDKSLSVDNEVHELKLGPSFDPKNRVAFHSIRYDFKPASVDTSKEAQLEVGEGHHVTLSVPHVEGSGKSHTVYKGNKKPVSKECVLIIDHETGTFTLERLSNNITVKKTRIDGSSKAQASGRPSTPVENAKQKTSPVKTKPVQNSHSAQSSPAHRESPLVMTEVKNNHSLIGHISDSDSSSSSGDSSSSDSEDENMDTANGVPARTQAPAPAPVSRPPVQSQTQSAKLNFMSTISADLDLSESSDSD